MFNVIQIKLEESLFMSSQLLIFQLYSYVAMQSSKLTCYAICNTANMQFPSLLLLWLVQNVVLKFSYEIIPMFIHTYCTCIKHIIYSVIGIIYINSIGEGETFWQWQPYQILKDIYLVLYVALFTSDLTIDHDQLEI